MGILQVCPGSLVHRTTLGGLDWLCWGSDPVWCKSVIDWKFPKTEPIKEYAINMMYTVLCDRGTLFRLHRSHTSDCGLNSLGWIHRLNCNIQGTWVLNMRVLTPPPPNF